MVENQYDCKIKMFQCDGGGEFISQQFLRHLQEHGIKQLISCPHTPQQNGLAERKHRHLTELGLSMLFQGKLPLKYWVEAFFTANVLSNLLPTSTLEGVVSPFEQIHGKSPVYSSLRSFGSACFPTLRDYASTKMDPKSLCCVFLGYNEKYKGYRCLYPPTGRVYISRHILFDENVFPFATTYSHLHPHMVTPLLSAWHNGFISSENRNENDSNVSDAAVSSTTRQAVASSESTSSQQNALVLNEENFPVLHRSTTSASTSAPTSTPVTDIQASVSGECTERTTGFEPASIGDSAPHSQTSLPVSSASSPAPNATQSLQPVITNTHSMTTRAKDGISKPNLRYVMLSHKVSYPEPKTVTSALKDPGGAQANGC